MNKIILMILSTIITSTSLYSQENDSIMKVISIISEVKTKFAPDKRVALFNIETEKSEQTFIIKGETNLPEAKMELMEQLKKENNELQIGYLCKIYKEKYHLNKNDNQK